MRVLGNDLMNQKLENDVSRRFIGNYLRLDNHKQKELLYSLIQHSSPNMIQSVRDYVHHRLKMDLVGTAPTDLSLAILQYLPPSDIGRISIVSKRWHRLCTDPYLWKYKCEELNLPLKSPSVKICPIIKENEEMTKKKYFPPNPDLSDENPSRIIPVTIGEMNRRCRFWKRCCERDYKTNLNWISQQYPYPMSYLAHKNYVITCLQYEEPYVVSGSDDNTLTVWNCQTNKFVSKLTGHHGGVWSSQLKNRICVSGSTDRSLRVWNILTGRCYHVLNGHSSTVRCLAMNEAGNLVASGSRDSTVRIWDIVKGIQVGEFHGHESAVRCICYHGKYIVSGAYDFTVRVWTLEKYIVHVLQGHSNRVYSLQCEGNIIASGSLDTTIRIWCIIKGTCLFSLDGHQSLTSSMRIQDDILISGNADATIRIWSLKTGGCLHILGNGSNEARHRTAVTAVSFHRNYIVTSSDDGTVKLWNKETGEFIRDLIRLANCYNGGVVWRLKVKNDRLICAAGSRNNTEPTKLLSVDFNHYFSNEMQMPNVIPMEEDELCLKSEIYQELLKLPEVNPNP
ncbi:hypothetical protein SNEBB_001910 [Seison nebaliae]|nr:hypothetical protein SNEBB_001910 [Seison nebaliae]